jgi:hypothetical protein
MTGTLVIAIVRRRGASCWIAALAGLALALAACTGPPGTPSPTGPTPQPSASSTATPSPSSTARYLFRATTSQATPPETRFRWIGPLTITGDLIAVQPGPQIEIYPSPLLPNLVARPITPAGFAQIAAEASRLGLLSGERDFLPSDIAPGSVTGRIEITADGTRYDFVGDPSRVVRCGPGERCIPQPGTPEAFGTFWQRLGDPAGWLGKEAGAEFSYVATSYALLLTEPPSEQPPLEPQVLDWPLPQRLSTFGEPIASADLPRCGTIEGADALTLRPLLQQANELTRWIYPPAAQRIEYGLVVHPMVPGEDICRELFGVGD